MMAPPTRALVGARIFDGERWFDDACVLMRAGRVLGICALADVPGAAEIVHLPSGVLAPAFIDIQVNGGGGVLLNDAPCEETIKQIVAAHRMYGTTGLLPTLITDTTETIQAAIAAVGEQSIEGVLGLHLEGPHLSVLRRGAHDQKYIRPMTEADVDMYLSANVGKLLITLAPEEVDPRLIRRLVDGGVVVSLGHTDATYDCAMSAIDSGATCVTHLFNAMSPFSHRAPGVVGAALDSPDVMCGVIADGLHASPAALRIALRAKRNGGALFLVTDAMATVGSAKTSFMLNGRTVSLRDNCLTLDDGTLAGSHLNMASAVRFCVDNLGLPLSEALRMASLYPARVLGEDRARGRIAQNAIADLVHLDAQLNVTQTWVGGRHCLSGYAPGNGATTHSP